MSKKSRMRRKEKRNIGEERSSEEKRYECRRRNVRIGQELKGRRWERKQDRAENEKRVGEGRRKATGGKKSDDKKMEVQEKECEDWKEWERRTREIWERKTERMGDTRMCGEEGM